MSRKLIMALIAALAALGWTLSVPAAYAGGPTSVLAVNPDTGAAAGFYHTSAQYERLVRAVDAYGTVGTQTDPPAALDESRSPNLRLTWLIHDQSVWRFDQIYLVGDEVWVQTMTDEAGMDDPFAQTGYWHQPEQATLVRTMLRSFDDPAAATTAPVPETTAPPVTQSAAPTGGSGLGLATATGAGGLVLGLAAGTLWRRSRRPQPDRVVLEG